METLELENGLDVKTTIIKTEDLNNKCCIKFCLAKFDIEFKLHLKTTLSNLTSLEKRIYLFGMISINEKKQNCSNLIKTSSKLYNYGVKKYGVLEHVCKQAFIELHDTTTTVVRTLCNKMLAKQLIPLDKRGKHGKKPTLPEQIVELIEAHLYATLESPTVRTLNCNLKNQLIIYFCLLYVFRYSSALRVL